MEQTIKNKIKKLLYSCKYPRDIIFCFYYLGSWSKTWRFRGLPIIQKHRSSKIIIGEDFIICSDPKQNSIGVFQKSIIKALSPMSVISIGNNVGISGATISGSNITIGNDVLIGSGVLISDNDAHPIDPKKRNDNSYIKSAPVIIEDEVFIGARSIILKGVTIGRGSVIGAGSVLSKNVPPYQIWAGNPAKFVKNLYS